MTPREEITLYSTGYLELSQIYATFKKIRATPATTAAELDEKEKALSECAKALGDVAARVNAREETP